MPDRTLCGPRSCVAALLRWPCILIVLLCDSHSAFPVDSELEHLSPRLHRLGLDASSSTQVPLRLRSRLTRRPGAAWSSLFFGKHLYRLRSTLNGIRPSPPTDAEPAQARAPGRASHHQDHDLTIRGTKDQAARRELLAAIRARATQNGNSESRARGPGPARLLRFHWCCHPVLPSSGSVSASDRSKPPYLWH